MGVITVKDLANWVDEPNELQAALLDGSSFKDDRQAKARLKMAWREASAQVSRAVKRTSEGCADELPDDPLPGPVIKSIMTSAQDYYKILKIDSRRIASDSLLSRVRREFERRQPSMSTILRVKTMAQSARSVPIKRSRLASGINMEVES